MNLEASRLIPAIHRPYNDYEVLKFPSSDRRGRTILPRAGTPLAAER
jgi:hypothetical protein